MARLAVVEQSIGDVDKFNKILFQLLQHMTHILNNPHDYDLRTLKTDTLEDVLKHEAFSDYLKYVGYRTVSVKISVVFYKNILFVPSIFSYCWSLFLAK